MINGNVFFSKGINYEKMNDEELIKLAKKEDKSALEFLIERYKDYLKL